MSELFRTLLFGAAAALVATAAPAKSNWTIDPARTHIKFAIDAVGWPRTTGVFSKFDGRISVDFERPERSRVAFVVQAASVDVGSATFDDFVRGPAMLDAGKFPTLAFTSTSVEKLNEHSVRVAGDMTLLGVTQPLIVEVDVRRQDGHLEFAVHTRLDRLQWGMNSGYPIISRDVDIEIASAASEQ